MKVLMLNGSCNPKGCTYTALTEVGKTLTSAGIDYDIVQLDGGPVRDCIGCNQCSKNGCVFTDDGVNDFIAKARQADGFVFGTPVYYAHPSGRILSVLDRVFYAGKDAFAHKPGAAVASARRAGTTASVDVLDKYFTIAQMPVVSSTYWNMVHGTRRRRCARTRRECRPCGIWPETCSGWSSASRRERPLDSSRPRRRARPGPTSSAEARKPPEGISLRGLCCI